jgi:hypothetical protein
MTSAPQPMTTLEARERQSGALYEYGRTAFFACRYDRRFSYALYVPPDLQDHESQVELVVLIHGTSRNIEAYREYFVDFARWNNCILLVPLFPVGVEIEGYRDGYKYFVENDIRYDIVLLEMVKEVGRKYARSFDQFAMFGFSGGGQFVNRFVLLYPECCWAVSIGAPGHVTLIDADRDWWVGTRGVGERLGRQVDLAQVRMVPVQMVVGSQDTESWEIQVSESDPQWVAGANDTGNTRRERLRALERSFTRAGIVVDFVVVPGAAHDCGRCVEPVKRFFAQTLAVRRARSALRLVRPEPTAKG